jgi:GT2 family glycosyltransferase
MNGDKISVVIPTMDNEEDLLRCVSSIAEQTSQPREIIIVNDGTIADRNKQSMRERIEPDVEFIITESDGPRGLSTAKNTGAQTASGDIVLFLDDDAVLREDYIKTLAQSYREYNSPQLAGIAGFDKEVSDRGAWLSRMISVLFFHPIEGWRINSAGFQSGDGRLSEPATSDWVPGYNSSYKRDLIVKYPFVYWNGGRETLEDVEVGWHLLKEGYHFVVDPRLDIEHHESGYTNLKTLGRKSGRNRVRIFRKHGETVNIPLFLWSALGEITKQVCFPFVDRNWKYHWSVARGLVSGYISELINL